MADAPRSRPASGSPDSVSAPDGFRAREFAAYAVVTTLGMAMLAGHRMGATATGRITLLAGLGGCAWELARWQRSLSKQRAGRVLQIARVQARAELKTARTEHKISQNTQRQRERHILRRAVHAQSQAQRTERDAQNARESRERARRSARFAAVTTEAARLQALPHAAWVSALTDIFALRGLHPQSDQALGTLYNDVHNITFVRVEDGGLCVARVLPPHHTGVVADVESLEQRRQQTGAQQAYLVGRDGFSAQTVRLAPRLPLTLVEPALLAQWNLTTTDSPPD